MSKKVYFAFHYQDVIDFRANVVRKHNCVGGAESAGYYDYSIWEESKKQGDVALKRMINAELENTSVTAVLIGSQTYERRWVRYEIMKSLSRGNQLVGIHINGIKGKDQKIKPLGPTPFEYTGVRFTSDGKKAQPIEWDGKQWIDYSDLEPWSVAERPAEQRGNQFWLAKWVSAYDWVVNDGFKNFSSWIT